VRAKSPSKDLPKGVGRVKSRYIARITFRGKRYFLGYWDTADEAHAARLAAEELLFAPALRGEIVPDYTVDEVRDYVEKEMGR
jgi:hypothetical protein